MAFNFVPAGVLLPFGGASAPAGWLLCDGSAVSRTAYAALFASLSIAWGYGDNSTTFNIPDMRGRFPRGRDGGAGRDPGDGRTVCNTGGNTNDNVGSVQSDATKVNGLTASATTPAVSGSTSRPVSGNTDISHDHGTHAHTVTYDDGGGGTADRKIRVAISTAWGTIGKPTVDPAGVSGITTSATRSLASGATDIAHTHIVPIVTVAGGGLETRPLNANVNYIIKV